MDEHAKGGWRVRVRVAGGDWWKGTGSDRMEDGGDGGMEMDVEMDGDGGWGVSEHENRKSTHPYDFEVDDESLF